MKQAGNIVLGFTTIGFVIGLLMGNLLSPTKGGAARMWPYI